MSIDIDKAEPQELKDYAINELGLALSLTMRAETMRQKIRDRQQELNKGAGNEDPPSAKVAKGDKSSAKARANYVTINIARSQEKGGGQPVFVGLNGKGFTIPRGIPIAVPPGVEYILRGAKQTVYEYEGEGSDQKLVPREVLTYPYQVVGGYENLFKDEQDAA